MKADNYECIMAIDHFMQGYFNQLQERVKKNYDFIFKGGYEKKCEKEGVKPDEKVIAKMKKSYDELFFHYDHSKKLLEACDTLAKRHEGIIDTLAKIYVGLRDNILYEGHVPGELMEEQREFLLGYFNDIKKILEPLKPDEL